MKITERVWANVRRIYNQFPMKILIKTCFPNEDSKKSVSWCEENMSNDQTLRKAFDQQFVSPNEDSKNSVS